LASALLWGVAAFEPAAYAGSLGLLAASALLAGAIPALRAARIDPARTLRDDT
jgi:ABC-type lipoprotein release transport system permease subunit